jgi:hypothetical protein
MKSSRFKEKESDIPGVGAYNVKPLESGVSVHIPKAKRWNDTPAVGAAFPFTKLCLEIDANGCNRLVRVF